MKFAKPAFATLTRDKQDTLLLVAAALLVIAPHFAHLPWWTSATVCATLLWRTLLTLSGRRLPPVWLLLPIALAAVASVWHAYGMLLGRDPGVAMLALLLAFKLLEMHAKRDLYVVLFLSFFLMLTNFFYSQSILTGLAMAVTILVLLTAQITFQYTGAVPSLGRRLRLAGRVFLLAAPLAALLFVVFPRIQGPLWGSPGAPAAPRTGISDTMAPGTLSGLALSEEVAFRVRFTGTPPAQDQRYWRGVVLSRYDGRTWSRIGGRLHSQDATLALRVAGTPQRYELTLEPNGRRYLFTLELSDPDFTVKGEKVTVTDELETTTLRPLQQRVRYQAVAWPRYAVQASLDPALAGKWLQLPEGFNPVARDLGGILRKQVGDDHRKAIDLLLAMFHTRGFSYTLEPPLLGRDMVDDFLFRSRQGFCEHYAGAFVYVMRAAGIPARVVTGYQGGELNPVDGYLTVRQADAHAWAEVWLAGSGWTRVDPTAAVAPDRVRLGSSRALPRPAPFGFAGLADLANDQASWLGKMRLHTQAVNNAWNQWVLDYNPDRQRNFLAELSDTFGHWRMAAAAVALVALAWLWQRMRARRRLDPVQAAWERFVRLLARDGIVHAPDEGPASLAGRVQAANLPPARQAALDAFLQEYGALRYRALDDDERRRAMRRLATLLAELR